MMRRLSRNESDEAQVLLAPGFIRWFGKLTLQATSKPPHGILVSLGPSLAKINNQLSYWLILETVSCMLLQVYVLTIMSESSGVKDMETLPSFIQISL